MTAMLVVNGVPQPAMTVGVVGAQGPAGPAVAPGSPGQFYVTNAAGTAPQFATVSGDVSADVVTVGKLTVNKINGASVPAAGGLVTGNGLYASGISSLAYSALNLAGGAGWVTGALPVGNIAPGTTAQLLVTNAGATAPAWVAMSGGATMTAAGVVTVAASTALVPPGTAGQIFVTNSSPVAAWTSLAKLELTHGRFTVGNSGSDYLVAIGPGPGSETSLAAIWLLPNATSLSLINMAMYSDGASTVINTPSGTGFIYLGYAGTLNSTIDHLGNWNFAASQAPKLSQAAPAATSAGTDMTLSPQSGGATSGQPGALIVNIAAPNGGSAETFLKVQRGGVLHWQIGPLTSVPTTFGAFYPGGVTPNGSNYAFYVADDGSNMGFNSSGTVGFNIAGVNYFGVTTGQVYLVTGTSFVLSSANNAASGTIRAPNNTTILAARNNANSGDLAIIQTNTSDAVIFGATTATIMTLTTFAEFATTVILDNNALQWKSTATAPQIIQPVGAGAGATMTVQAQGGAAATDGGALVLTGGAHGAGTQVDGSVKITSPMNPGEVEFTPVNGANALSNAQSDANAINLLAGATNPFTITYLRRIADTSWVVVRNNTTQVATIAFQTGGTVAVAASTSALIASNGANLVKMLIGT